MCFPLGCAGVRIPEPGAIGVPCSDDLCRPGYRRRSSTPASPGPFPAGEMAEGLAEEQRELPSSRCTPDCLPDRQEGLPVRIEGHAAPQSWGAGAAGRWVGRSLRSRSGLRRHCRPSDHCLSRFVSRPGRTPRSRPNECEPAVCRVPCRSRHLQNLTRWSLPPVTRVRLSGLKALAQTQSVCPHCARFDTTKVCQAARLRRAARSRAGSSASRASLQAQDLPEQPTANLLGLAQSGSPC